MLRLALLAILGVACGCIRGSSGNALTVSGVAASGAAVSGTVRLRNAFGTELSVNTSDGGFSFDVTRLTPPFVLKVEWLDGNGALHALYSVALTVGTYNINPLTTLAVADASGLSDPADLFDSPNLVTLSLTSARMTASMLTVRARIAPLLASYSGADVDPLTVSFSADHTGLDLFLDDVTVTITSGIATISRSSDGAVLLQGSAASIGSAVVFLGWSAQEALIANDPQTAVDSAGNALVVWSEDDGGRFNIHANRFTSSAGWEGAVLVSDGTGDTVAPVIAADGSGNAMAAWYQWDGTKSRIQASRYTPAGGWSSPVLIDDDGGEANYPAIAVNAGGDCVVAWHQFVGPRTDVWAARFTLGQGWSAAAVLSDQVNSDFRAQVALDGSGTATVAWTQAIGFRQTLWASQAAGAGAWSAPEQISTLNVDVYGQTSLAVDSSGNVIALWGQAMVGVGYVATAALYRAGSGWEAAVTVGDGGGDSYFPSVAMNGSGEALAVWKETDNQRYNIWAARFSLAGGWQAPTMVSDLTGDGGYPHAALDSNGNLRVSWSQLEGATYSIRAVSSIAGNGWGSIEVLYQNAVPSGVISVDSFPSSSSMNASGTSLVVWGTTS
jgi:hypothetical protein